MFELFLCAFVPLFLLAIAAVVACRLFLFVTPSASALRLEADRRLFVALHDRSVGVH